MSEEGKIPPPDVIDKLRRHFRPRGEHHRCCSSRSSGNRCDCYAWSDAEAHELLDQIVVERDQLRATTAEHHIVIFARRPSDMGHDYLFDITTATDRERRIGELSKSGWEVWSGVAVSDEPQGEANST